MIDKINDISKRELSEKESDTIMDLVRSNHSMSNNLMGASTVALTFLLGLTYQSDTLNDPLFQAVLVLIIVGISSFGLSGFYYSLYEANYVTGDHVKLLSDIKKADLMMVIGLNILWLNPPLITQALGIYWVAMISFAITSIGILIFFYEYDKHKIQFIVTNVYQYYLEN